MAVTRSRLVLAGLFALVLLSACGGGGGGGGSPATATPPAPDSEPDAFTVQAVADAVRGAAVESPLVTIQGINTAANVTVAGGEYSVNGSAFTSAAGTVTNGQHIVIRVIASADPGGVVEATLTVGSVSAKFTVTTSTDVTPPTVTMIFPRFKSRTSSEELIVRGTANDTESPVTSVRVNGVEAVSSNGFATWTATIPLAAGANAIVIDAMDRALNRSAATPHADVVHNALIAMVEGLAVDTVRGRAIAADTAAATLLSIDLATGLRTVIAKNTKPLEAMAIDRLWVPGSIVLEADGTHAFVLDRGGPAAILRVDLATGARTVVSGRGIPNAQNELANAMSMSVDLANGYAYVLGRAPHAVYRVDLANGQRTILSDADTPNGGPLFPNPMTMALDAANNRLLVGDQGATSLEGHALYAVDLATGVRSIFSSNAVPDAANPFEFIAGIGIDAAANRALASQPYTSSILAVDLATGARSVFSSAHALEQPGTISVDSADGRAFVVNGTRSLLAVDLATAVSTVLSPNEPSDIGVPLRASTGVALDLPRNRIYVTDPLSHSVISVDLTTGDRSLVSSSSTPFGPIWLFPGAVALDAPNDRLLVSDLQGKAIYAVALANGVRTVLSENGAQSGVAFAQPGALVLDSKNNRALVADPISDAVVAVNLTDGARSLFSGPSVPNDVLPLSLPFGIALDAAGNRALVTSQASVVAVDLTTGARTPFANAGPSGDWLPITIGIDAETRTIVSGDASIGGALHAIDASSGARTVVSSETAPRSNDKLKASGVAVDGARRIAWVTNEHFAILQVVDLVTGERVFLTR